MKRGIEWKYLAFAIASALGFLISLDNLPGRSIGGLGGIAVAFGFIFSLQGKIFVVFLVSLATLVIYFLIKFLASILEAIFSKSQT